MSDLLTIFADADKVILDNLDSQICGLARDLLALSALRFIFLAKNAGFLFCLVAFSLYLLPLSTTSPPAADKFLVYFDKSLVTVVNFPAFD